MQFENFIFSNNKILYRKIKWNIDPIILSEFDKNF